MDYKTTFSNNLLRLRKENKLSLRKLGGILGITNQAVSLLEQGKNSPKFSVLTTIADYFEVSIDYLIGRCNDPDMHKR